MPMRVKQPLLLRVEFDFPLESANHVIAKIIGPMQRQIFKCCHGKYSMAIIVMTDESSHELVDRLRLKQITGIADYSCHVAPIGAICMHGGMNTFATALDKAWDAVGKRRNPEYMRQTKRFDPRFEDRVKDPQSGAIRKMKVKPPSPRQPPEYPDRYKR